MDRPGNQGLGIERKLEKLRTLLSRYGSVLVAFSGGCDSAFVAKVAYDVLGGERMKAVTAKSPSLAESEIFEVESFVERFGIDHHWINTAELEDPRYAQNPINRCYFCKNELYQRMRELAGNLGIQTLVNGVNQDDLGDWRPGIRAASEHLVKSPLVDAQLSKSEIRELSRKLGLPTWDKPAAACLSSRFPYHHHITEEKLRQVDRGEAILKEHGFHVVRLRHYGSWARIEVGQEELSRLKKDQKLFEQLVSKIKGLGFESVELDPEGYRQGKLNTHKVPT